jgi:hypothetical protein
LQLLEIGQKLAGIEKRVYKEWEKSGKSGCLAAPGIAEEPVAAAPALRVLVTTSSGGACIAIFSNVIACVPIAAGLG